MIQDGFWTDVAVSGVGTLGALLVALVIYRLQLAGERRKRIAEARRARAVVPLEAALTKSADFHRDGLRQLPAHFTVAAAFKIKLEIVALAKFCWFESSRLADYDVRNFMDRLGNIYHGCATLAIVHCLTPAIEDRRAELSDAEDAAFLSLLRDLRGTLGMIPHAVDRWEQGKRIELLHAPPWEMRDKPLAGLNEIERRRTDLLLLRERWRARLFPERAYRGEYPELPDMEERYKRILPGHFLG